MEGRERIVLLLLSAVAAVAIAAIVCSDDVEGLTYDVGLTFKDPSNVRTVQGLEPIMFNYTVKDIGEYMTEEVIVKVENEPSLWQHILSASTKSGVRTSTGMLEILLQKGEVAPLTLTISPAQLQRGVLYWLTLDVYPKKDPGLNKSHDVCIYRSYGAVDVKVSNEPPEGRFTEYPSGAVFVQFAILNLGNVADRYQLSAVSSLADSGWELTVDSGADGDGLTGIINPSPDRSHPYHLNCTVRVPTTAMANETSLITVRATSSFEPTQWAEASTSVVALQIFEFEARFLWPGRKEGLPGHVVEFQLLIRNTGNGQDLFTVRAFWDEQLNPGFSASVVPSKVLLAAREEANVTYTVRVPGDASKRAYFFSADVTSSSEGVPPIATSAEVEVGQSYRIGLSSPQTEMATLPGGVLDFEVDVVNEGNGLDSIAFSLVDVPTGWLSDIRPLETSLLQAERMRVSLRLILPSSFESAPSGKIGLTFVAASTRGDARAALPLGVTIDQFHRIEWMDGDKPITDPAQPVATMGVLGPGPSVNPYEGGRAEVVLHLRNYGNGDDEVTIWVTAPIARVNATVVPTSVQLPWAGTIDVTVRIEVPTSVSPDKYVLTVTAESSDTALEPRVVPLEFTVFSINARVPPTPTCAGPTEGPPSATGLYAREGTLLSFNLAVTNAGTAPLPACLVRCYDVHLEDGSPLRWNFLNLTVPTIAVGGTYVLGATAANATSAPLTWCAREPGPHTLEFTVLCDHQSDTTDDTSRVNVTVDWTPPTVVGGSEAHWPAVVMLVAMAVAALVLGTGLERRGRSRAHGTKRADR